MLSRIITLVTLTTYSFIVGAETISMRADSWCPYNCEPGSRKPGYVVEILYQALSKAGYTVDYKILGWDQSLKEAQDGKISGVIGASEGELKGGISTQSIGMAKNCFYVKANSEFRYNGVKSLIGRKIGVISGYKYGKELDDDIISTPGKYTQASGDSPLEANVSKLEAGNLDMVLENESVFSYMIGGDELNPKYKSAGCLADDRLFVSFSGKNPKAAEYVKLINEALVNLKNSGELKRILDKYRVKDWN